LLLGAVLGACAAPVVLRAAPLGAPTGPAPVARETAADVAARRRRELDELQRYDAAVLLAQMGVRVDWRAYPLEALLDMRLRIAKAAALRAQFGVAVDWRRYNWEQLDGVTRALAGLEAPRPAPEALRPAPEAPQPAAEAPRPVAETPRPRPEARVEELVTPTFVPLPARRDVAGDPDAVLSPTFTARRPPPVTAGDPDAVLTPTFAASTRWPRGGQGPDGLITPTFAPTRQTPASAPADSDALLTPMF
jgi:hypothetical protein